MVAHQTVIKHDLYVNWIRIPMSDKNQSGAMLNGAYCSGCNKLIELNELDHITGDKYNDDAQARKTAWRAIEIAHANELS
jgi:hypothetical protein